MKRSTGIVRHADLLGRIVIPRETREKLYIKSGDPVEIYREGKQIYIRKYTPGCIFCSGTTDLMEFGDYNVCRKCRDELAGMARDL
ncbi:MAG: AbrB/MazE/SpoVT family DNA-binding domain-containing protein [Clostridia bacterium]|nr:AbrB/MazE/SpoVT family DNA-binding domain-containing protein [Clostridia bacterium]MDR3643861.1 AbrB/MazE/SpoVT family DNA-binding domain-containing protein [Clostridia bacterium]